MANNHQYSQTEMMRMQQDAMRRVREMHQRARSSIQQNQPQSPQEATQPSLKKEKVAPSPTPQAQKTPAPSATPSSDSIIQNSTVQSLLERFGIDGERALLLLLILLLLNEKADIKLILALCYLLL